MVKLITGEIVEFKKIPPQSGKPQHFLAAVSALKARCPGLAEGYAAMKKELKDNKTALKDPGRTGA